MSGVGDADTIATSEPLRDTIADRQRPRDSQPVIERGGAVGRFVVLDVLGTGGMGVVYAAYDPNLDRKVAIKVLRAQAMGSEEARTRLLREAQAMARIDHPNVLRVHEAGNLGERVFIAMEFASGGTLRDWLSSPHSVDEIIAMFVQAARGLAAAHAAGLVHRDFKPDNVLIVGDGQARVTDFGLVGVVGEVQAQPAAIDRSLSGSTPLSADLTRTGAVLGTPAYMSPEQFKGGEIGPAADQFAFCVALWEALFKTRPFLGATYPELCAAVIAGALQAPPRESQVPARIRRAVQRGLASEPSRRYASMDKLIADLVAEKRSGKGAWIAASVAGMVALGTAGVLVARSGTEVCGGADAKIAAVWGAPQKQKLETAFAASKRPDAKAVFDRTLPIVDGWGKSWQVAYVGACEDTRVRKIQSEQVLDMKMQCLSRDLDEARAALDVLAAGGGDAVDHAIEVARGLPTLAACSDTAALASGIAPPPAEVAAAVAGVRSKLDQARAQRKLARYADATKLAKAALDEARATKYDPVIAQALLEVGRLQAQAVDPKASDSLAEAMSLATAVGDQETAIRAASRRLVLMAKKPATFPVADEINREMTALAAHAPVQPSVKVDIDDAAGMLLQRERKMDAAQARYEKALQLATAQLGPDAPDTLTTLQSLGTLAAERHKFEDAKKLFDQVLAAQERIVGKDHPDYATALEHEANILSQLGKGAEVKALRDQALAIRIAALGPDHPDVATSYEHIAGYYQETGDYAHAKEFYDKGLAIERKVYGEDGVEQTTMLDNYGQLLSDMGQHAEARAMLDKSLALREKAYGPDDPRVADVLADVGINAKAERRYDDAIAAFERVKKIAEKAYGPNDGDVLDALGNLAASYMEAGRLPEAKEHMAKLITLMAEVNGPESLRMGLTLGNDGFLQIKLKDYKAALASFQKAHAIFEAKIGKNHPNTAFVMIGEAQSLIQLKREAEAVPLLERALEIGNASHIAPAQLGEIHYYLAIALVKDRARAKTEMGEAVKLYEQSKSPDAKLAKKWLASH